ncbi:MAG: NUDIX domain-containing protein [Chloroflexi bacterium]|nr:NUDIX domain-containing protein [Chloroflexota bacterium]
MSQDNLSLFPYDEIDSHVLPDNILSDKVINWLTDLYDLTDWRCVILDGAIDREYDGVPISSYFKALALPYLVNISPSERTLERIILDRINLQKLCGFRIGHSLKKLELSTDDSKPILNSRTFWHFRDKYEEIYPELVVKVLISLVLSGKYPNFALPFVEKISEGEFDDKGNLIKWSIDAYRPTITISLPWSEKDLLTEKDKEKFEEWKEQWSQKFRRTEDLEQYRILKTKYDEEYKSFARRARKGFTEEVKFPIDVFTNMISGEKIFFRLNRPNWLSKDENSSQTSIYIGSDTPKSNSTKNKYNKACNLLVIRTVQGEREMLLSQRKINGVAEGNFAAPGGKQNEGESLEQCAKRELLEETGLILKKSKPVSLYYTWQESMRSKQIMSVGVLVEAWTGEVETKEPDKHVGWGWYKLDNLPAPLFEFTNIAIVQFLENKYPNLTWDDVEEKPEIPKIQLGLFEERTE